MRRKERDRGTTVIVNLMLALKGNTEKYEATINDAIHYHEGDNLDVNDPHLLTSVINKVVRDHCARLTKDEYIELLEEVSEVIEDKEESNDGPVYDNIKKTRRVYEMETDSESESFFKGFKGYLDTNKIDTDLNLGLFSTLTDKFRIKGTVNMPAIKNLKSFYADYKKFMRGEE